MGRSLGLVLSGGGARGFAYIGVLAELEQDGIEVDRYRGCSMGALIAAMAASGRRASEIRDLGHEELVRRSAFDDDTFPRVALVRSREAARMLRRLFADLTIDGGVRGRADRRRRRGATTRAGRRRGAAAAAFIVGTLSRATLLGSARWA